MVAVISKNKASKLRQLVDNRLRTKQANLTLSDPAKCLKARRATCGLGCPFPGWHGSLEETF